MHSSASLADVAAVAEAVEACEARLAAAALEDAEEGGSKPSSPRRSSLSLNLSLSAVHAAARRGAPDPAAASLLAPAQARRADARCSRQLRLLRGCALAAAPAARSEQQPPLYS